MSVHHNLPADKDEAKRALAARGFGTFKRWEKANREGERLHRKTRPALAAALNTELYRYIRPNL